MSDTAVELSKTGDLIIKTTCERTKRKLLDVLSTEMDVEQFGKCVANENTLPEDDPELRERCLVFTGIPNKKGASLYVLIYQVIQDGLQISNSVRPDDIGRVWPFRRGGKVEFRKAEHVKCILRASGKLADYRNHGRKIRISQVLTRNEKKLKELQDMTIFRLRDVYNLETKDIQRSSFDHVVFDANTVLNPEPTRRIVHLREAVFILFEKVEELEQNKQLAQPMKKLFDKLKNVVKAVGYSLRRDECVDTLARSIKRELDLTEGQDEPGFKRSRPVDPMEEEEESD